ncbi:hypothetical protein AB7202_13755 [Providencia stuartii]|nr:hypothetical protein [Proteus mirabilis]
MVKKSLTLNLAFSQPPAGVQATGSIKKWFTIARKASLKIRSFPWPIFFTIVLGYRKYLVGVFHQKIERRDYVHQ